MIPLRPTRSGGSFPLLTWLLIMANLAAMLAVFLAPEVADWYMMWAFVPSAFFANPVGEGITLLTSLFLHAGLLHIVGNMLYLSAFGPIAEAKLGPIRFLGLYILAGALGMIAQGLVAPQSTTPIVGASGAIAGILGAVLVVARHTKVTTLVPAFITIEIAELPAGFLVVTWMALQLASSVGQLDPSISSVAWFAHLGGVTTGLVLGLLSRRR